MIVVKTEPNQIKPHKPCFPFPERSVSVVVCPASLLHIHTVAWTPNCTDSHRYAHTYTHTQRHTQTQPQTHTATDTHTVAQTHAPGYASAQTCPQVAVANGQAAPTHILMHRDTVFHRTPDTKIHVHICLSTEMHTCTQKNFKLWHQTTDQQPFTLACISKYRK